MLRRVELYSFSIFLNFFYRNSSENWKFIATFFMITIPLILHYIFILPYFDDVALGVINGILHLLTYIFMTICIFMDPGIIPKIVNITV